MPKQKLTQQDFQQAADTLGCHIAAVKAVAEVESRESGFLENDEPVILFERHIFSARTHHLFDKVNPNISNSRPGGYGKLNEQHARLAEAVKLDRDAALMSCSWGKFQIMGFNFSLAGYNTLQDFINAMYRSEKDHLQAFIQYLKEMSLDDELRNQEWAEFAKRYNGPGYKRNRYDTKLKAAFKKYLF